VRNTPRVTGFVGSGTTPVPVTDEEIKFPCSHEWKELKRQNILYWLHQGEVVFITDGPFKDLEGRVSEIDHDRGKVKVMVNMFGRETSVELDFVQVKKL
jgi:transcriptional antiterminator NusG